MAAQPGPVELITAPLLDQRMKELVADPTSATGAALRAGFLTSVGLVLSPVAPTSPTPGTVWINTSTS